MVDSSLQKFQNLLRELFQFDCADLDFGIYRILNYKRQQIEEFIANRLPEIVNEAFAEYLAADRTVLEQELKSLKQQILQSAKDLGQEPFDEEGNLKEEFRGGKLGKQYLEVQAKLEKIRVTDELKTRVYNDLFNFFSRYYEDGDFISKRRYYGRGEAYFIPYNGEEVLLYWANKDQYYVKTGEHFKTYRFNVEDFAVSFELRNVSTEQNNNKGQKRYFMLIDDAPLQYDAERKTLTIFFEYRPLTEEEQKTYGKTEQQKPQDKLNEAATQVILEQVPELALKAYLAKTEGNNGQALLFKHLTRFTRRNTSDFFVHKDLRGFLMRELDFYLKNEILLVDELLNTENPDLPRQRLLQAQVVRRVAESIVDFLSQVEDFQKRLFEKKKFVVQTEYCFTIDRIPEDLWDEVLRNDSQIAEWRHLYALEDLLEQEGLNKDFLLRHPTLVVDTRHFSEDFKWRLLASFDDLDDAIDGVLIKSENFQALNLLLEKYRAKVKCIYIDPPYNRGDDEFLYKDNYQHSCWLSMMADRLVQAKELMSIYGAFFVTIDDNELQRLRALFDIVFGSENFIQNIIWRKKSGGGQQDDYIVTEHDYIPFFAKRKRSFKILEKSVPKPTENYTLYDEQKARKYKRVKLAKWGSAALREDRPTMYFPITDPDGNEVYPVSPDGRPGRWRYGKARIQEMINNEDIDWIKENGVWIPYEKEYEPTEEDKKVLKERSIFYDLAENADGSNELKALFGFKDAFLNPKPSDLIYHLCLLTTQNNDIIADFFAGSGTTAHAIINLNRQDGSRRKYILVEMGSYFETVLLPRIKKVVFCENWKDGKPVGGEGISHMLKYQTLEQYEDTLNNLEVWREQEGQLAFKMFGDEYLLRYMLEFETQGSPSLLDLEQFKDPFRYRLKVQEGDEIVERMVDMVETFNYLLGLEVKKVRAFEGADRSYLAVLGEKDGKRVVIIWRPINGLEENKEALLQDRAFIEKRILPGLLGKGAKPDRLLVNGSCYVEGAESIEPVFKQLMFAEVV